MTSSRNTERQYPFKSALGTDFGNKFMSMFTGRDFGLKSAFEGSVVVYNPDSMVLPSRLVHLDTLYPAVEVRVSDEMAIYLHFSIAVETHDSQWEYETVAFVHMFTCGDIVQTIDQVILADLRQIDEQLVSWIDKNNRTCLRDTDQNRVFEVTNQLAEFICSRYSIRVDLSLSEDLPYGDDSFTVQAMIELTDHTNGTIHKLKMSRDHELDSESDPYVEKYYSILQQV